jgi:hypothetical protein
MEAIYYRRNKSIVVITTIGYIPVKLKAPRTTWHFLWVSLDCKKPIVFEIVAPFLSKRTPQQTKDALKQLSLDHPAIFEAGFVSAVIASCGVNRLHRPSRKTRNPGAYHLSWNESNRISAQAVHLYSLLKGLTEIPIRYWPNHLTAMLDKYGVEPADLLSQTTIKETVACVLSEHHGLSMPGEYPARFWKSFVTEKRPRLMDLPLPGADDPVLGELFENPHFSGQHS